MKTFKLSIFKGCNMTPIATKIVTAQNQKELTFEKNGFRSEFATWFKNPKNWLGVKRINPTSK